MVKFLFFVSLVCFIVGTFRLSRTYGVRRYDAAFVSGMLTFGFLVLVSLMLTRFGLHQLWMTAFFLLLGFIAVLLLARVHTHAREYVENQHTERWDYVLVILALTIALFHAAYPTYYMLGGRDPGLYFIYSVFIGETGGLELPTAATVVAGTVAESLINVQYPGLYDPARYGFESDPTIYFAQFHHSFSTFGAILYQLFGIEGVVRTNALISFLALWSFGEALRRLVDVKLAVLGVLFLGLNVAFAWNARITLTEIMSLAAVFAGIVFLLDALTKDRSDWRAVIAGAVFALAVVARIDGVLISGLLLGLVALYGRNDVQVRRTFVLMMSVYAVLSSIALLDAWQHSPGYYLDLWRQGSSKYLVYGHFVSLFLVGIIIALRSRSLWPLSSEYFERHWASVVRIVAVAFAALFAFLYFVYPGWQPEDFGHRAFREMAWYVSPLLLATGPLGLWLSARREDHRLTAALILFFLIAVVLFSVEPAISPDHIWASRRWVPLVIPGLILSFLLCLDAVHKRWRFLLVFIGTLIYAVSLYPYAKHFYTVSILDGYHEDYASAARQLRTIAKDPETVFLTRNAQIASVLRYGYDLPVVLVSDPGLEVLLRGTLPVGEPIYMLGTADMAASLSPISTFEICGQYLRKYRSKRPDALTDRCYDIAVFPLANDGDQRSTVELPVQPGYFFSQSGKWQGTGIASTGAAGWLLYGPYSFLVRGDYRIKWQGSFDCGDLSTGLVFQVSARRGEEIVVSTETASPSTFSCESVSGQSEVALMFSVESLVSDVEYRIYASESIDAVIESVVVQRL